MPRSDKIRNYGLIPERRHDAFLLALLLALALNAAFFAIQAIIPRIASLLQLLGPEAALQKEEEGALPFVLVDPSLFDEPVDDRRPDAESLVDREARQAETAPADLPEDKPFVEEGVDELQSMPEGNPGPEESSAVNAPESSESAPTPSEEQAPGEQGDDGDVEPVEPTEPIERDEAADVPEEEGEPEEPVSEPVEPPPPPEPEPEPEPQPEPEPVEANIEQFVPPPPMDAEPMREPPPEPPLPEAIPEPEPVPEPPVEPVPEPLPEESFQPDPVPETIDLAALPIAPDGLYDPQRRYLEEMIRRDAAPRPVPEWREQPRDEAEEYEEYARRQYEALRETQQQRPRQQQSEQQPSRREGRRQPTFRRIGRSGSAGSAPSRAGGAPRHRNQDSRIDVLDSDPNMKYLAHKYAEYMRKMARLLQESLNREVLLQPVGYTVGQAKLVFTIAPDGTLGQYRTLYPTDGELDYVRITSEQTLINAGPFDPPTPEMLRDPVFKQMSLTVNLY